jgi:hypothetical protein
MQKHFKGIRKNSSSCETIPFMRVQDKRDLGDKSAQRDLILLSHEMSQFMRENKEHSHSANIRGHSDTVHAASLQNWQKNGYFKFAQIPTMLGEGRHRNPHFV